MNNDKIASSVTSKITFGLMFPLEGYESSVPKMENQVTLAQQAEVAGFSHLWVRDVPLHVPTFGDAGQMFDPWVYMTHIAAQTNSITLGTASIILPLRHPIHTAKSAASIDVLTDGRLVLGVASGDRAQEYPAFGRNLDDRAHLFRENFSYIKTLWQQSFPQIRDNYYGQMQGETDLLPKPLNGRSIPMYVTGQSGQDINWIARHADGWIYYPRSIEAVEQNISTWTEALDKAEQPMKPYMQSLYIDLLDDPDAPPTPIHLGFKIGRNGLLEFLKALEGIGVNHVIFVLKYATRPVDEIIAEMAEEILPRF